MNFPILSSLILLPLIGSFFIFFSKSKNETYESSKYIALFIALANFVLSIYLWFIFDRDTSEFQFVENRKWILGFVNYIKCICVSGTSVYVSVVYMCYFVLNLYISSNENATYFKWVTCYFSNG